MSMQLIVAVRMSSKIAILLSSSELQFIHQNGVHGQVCFFLPADEGAHPGDSQTMMEGQVVKNVVKFICL